MHWVHSRYISANRPCLIRGLDGHFAEATRCWTTSAGIDPSWFLHNISNAVPVRVPVSGGIDELDSEGRATECETKLMTITEWVAYLDSCGQQDVARLYLKDWHLQLLLESDGASTEAIPLYTIPPVFPKDMLNPFLNKYNAGDYRFVYWGPAGSATPMHSDVMDSFSWSYNVAGVKEWTFFFDDDDSSPITLIQRQGELVFVPSGLRHCVTNVEETISINHNWITSDIVNKVWQCLLREDAAVELELASWSLSQQMDARENMLRGCFGVNVTSFFFMVMWGGLNCVVGEGNKSRLALQQLKQAMVKIINEDTIDLNGRLLSYLGCSTKVESAMAIARQFVDLE